MLKYPRMDPFEQHRLGIAQQDTAGKFRRQVRLQVYLPLAVGILLLAGLAALLWRGQVGDASVWADGALAFLLLAAMILGLVVLVIFSALMVGVWLAVRRLPEPFERARLAVARAEHAADQAARRAALPMIVPKAILHAITTGYQYLAGIFRGAR